MAQDRYLLHDNRAFLTGGTAVTGPSPAAGTTADIVAAKIRSFTAGVPWGWGCFGRSTINSISETLSASISFTCAPGTSPRPHPVSRTGRLRLHEQLLRRQRQVHGRGGRGGRQSGPLPASGNPVSRRRLEPALSRSPWIGRCGLGRLRSRLFGLRGLRLRRWCRGTGPTQGLDGQEAVRRADGGSLPPASP